MGSSAFTSAHHHGDRRPVRRTLIGVLAGTMAAFGLVPLAGTAQAAPGDSLGAFGPVDQTTGYPFWFGDNGGDGLDPVRLELCLDDEQDPLCPVVGDRPAPADPVSMPENFPDESFWWSAEALVDTGGVRSRLVLGMEAAFGGSGEVAVGQQVAFQRLRVRIDDLPPLQTYTITSPYGVDQAESDDRGRLFMTDDAGCLSPPCGWEASLRGRIGPFLRWDPAVAPAAPEGYLGDGATPHQVVGSPLGTNIFRVEGPDVGGPGVNEIETDLFTVQGRIARPRATIDLPGDLYALGTAVSITPSFPGESVIRYTLDGTDPAADSPTTTTHTSTDEAPAAVVELPLGEDTELRYVVESGGQTSEVYSQVYDVRENVSLVTATPTPDPATVLEGRQEVALAASMEGRIFYTTDGTRPDVDGSGDPTGTTREYTDPISIARSTLVRAFSAPSAEGEQPGPVARFPFVIHNLREVSPDRIDGFPSYLTDIGLPSAADPSVREDAVSLELCLDDPLCPVVGELPDALDTDPTTNRGPSFPDNYPDELFWWSGEAIFDDAAGNDVRLVLAAEAAFGGLGAVAEGEQVGFGRIRVRYDDGVAGATYRFVHPYGVVEAVADDRGRVRYTEDTGCMNSPCGVEGGNGPGTGFNRFLTNPVGPFLRWDSGAPEGYVGDPNIEHTVTGSPWGTNEFVVDQVTNAAGVPLSSPVRVGSTNLFAVQGKLAGGPGVIASQQSGVFADPFDVTLTGNPVTEEILYTTDGTDPVTNGQEYDGPIHVGPGATTLTYVGVAADGSTSMAEVEDYTVQLRLTASPAGGTFDRSQTVTLSSNDPTAIIRFTTDGSAAGPTSPVYTGPLTLDRTTRVRTWATNAAGNAAGDWTFTDNVAPARPTASPAGGDFAQTQTVTLSTDDPGATIRYTTNGNDPATGQVYSGPITVAQSRTLRAVAVDRSGNPSPGDQWVFTITPPQVTLDNTATQVVRVGGGTTFAGGLTSGDQAIAGATVVLQSAPATTSGVLSRRVAAKAVGGAGARAAVWQDVTTTTTDANGEYAFDQQRPRATTAYRVLFAGDADHAQAVGPTQLVKVRGVAKLTRMARSVRKGTKLAVRGTLRPRHPGSRVTVRFVGPGHRTKRVAATVNRRGVWKVRTRVPGKPGWWTVSARWRGDADHLGSVSNHRVLRVRRR